MTSISEIVWVDVETISLSPVGHTVYEVAAVTDTDCRHWWLPVDLVKADRAALDVGRFHERHPNGVLAANPTAEPTVNPSTFARAFAQFTWGATLGAACPTFDVPRLERLLLRNGQTPGWRHRVVDVEAYTAGRFRLTYMPSLAQCAELAGVSRLGEPHTAMSDALLAQAVYRQLAFTPGTVPAAPPRDPLICPCEQTVVVPPGVGNVQATGVQVPVQ